MAEDSRAITVLVSGAGIVGGKQKVSYALGPSYAGNLRRLASCLQLQPEDARLTSVSVYDADFDEYVLVEDFADLQDRAKLQVVVEADSSSGTPPEFGQLLVRADAAVAQEVERLAGAGAARAIRERQEGLRTVLEAVANGTMDPRDAGDAIKAESTRPVAQPRPSADQKKKVDGQAAAAAPPSTSRDATAGRNRVGANQAPKAETTNAAEDDEEDAPRRRVKKAAPPVGAASNAARNGASAATPPPEETSTAAVAGDSPAPADVSAVSIATSGHRSPRRREYAPRHPERPSSPKRPTIAHATTPRTGLVEDGSEITAFCVYNGALTQRAKAVRISRRSPNLKHLLSVLADKFKSQLALGYIEVGSGAFIEILDNAHLLEVIERDCVDSDSLTLQCWRPDGLGDAEEEEAAAKAAKSPAPAARGTSGAHREVAVTPSGKRLPSQAAQSVGSRMDVSGVAYTDEQLRELFDELDVDNSGYLDIEEFRVFFRSQYDDMGINDVDKKFEKMVAATPGFDDGELDFDEFALVMLKLAQW